MKANRTLTVFVVVDDDEKDDVRGRYGDFDVVDVVDKMLT